MGLGLVIPLALSASSKARRMYPSSSGFAIENQFPGNTPYSSIGLINLLINIDKIENKVKKLEKLQLCLYLTVTASIKYLNDKLFT
jgi:hypothetical protein